MKQLPPPMLVKTWLYIIFDEEGMDSQKFKLRKSIQDLFGSIELAQLYIERISEGDSEAYFI